MPGLIIAKRLACCIFETIVSFPLNKYLTESINKIPQIVMQLFYYLIPIYYVLINQNKSDVQNNIPECS
jgi:ABC-type polysaccharide/polyol phosphate export permease